VSALSEFDDLGRPCHVVYVQAPGELRSARLSRRAEPPASSVDGISVTFVPSDNHPLPSTAERTLYVSDDFSRLASSPRWRDHIFRIDNDVDDGGAKVQSGLSQFIAQVTDPYRTPVPSAMSGLRRYEQAISPAGLDAGCQQRPEATADHR
jgi:hypothetical protein